MKRFVNKQRTQQNIKNSHSRHWAAINEFGFLAGMRLLFWICNVFGRWPFRLMLYPVLVWYVLMKPSARRASRDYLKHINQITPIDTSIYKVIQHFAAFAEMMLDKMLLWGALLDNSFDASSVRFVGIEKMNQLIAEKRGALLICAHFGNLDLCRVLSKQHSEFKLTVLVHTKHASMFNHLLETINPASQLNLVQVTELTPSTAIMLAEKVAQGEFVVIAGDRIPVAKHPRVVTVNFLGAPVQFPVGPYILASILQCPIYTMFSMRISNTNSHREIQNEIRFELLRDSVSQPRKKRDELWRELASEFAARLETHCLSTPLQWFNFYDYWHLPSMDITDEPR